MEPFGNVSSTKFLVSSLVMHIACFFSHKFELQALVALRRKKDFSIFLGGAYLAQIVGGSAEKIIKIRPTVAELSVKNHFPIVNAKL